MRIRVAFKKFNISNTGLDKANRYPELSTTFKAAFLKSSLWFFAKVAIQISENHPEEACQPCFFGPDLKGVYTKIMLLLLVLLFFMIVSSSRTRC